MNNDCLKKLDAIELLWELGMTVQYDIIEKETPDLTTYNLIIVELMHRLGID